MENFHSYNSRRFSITYPSIHIDAIREICHSRNTSPRRKREISLGEVCRQLESLRMAMTRDRDEGGLEREKKFNYKHGGRDEEHGVRGKDENEDDDEETRGRLRRSRPNGHGLAPGKTLSAKRRESVQRLSLGFKKLLITWIFSSVPPR